MDLHNMKRKELQKLCKEHNIPANLTNLDMVDKLSSFFKGQEKEEPMRKTRSCLKNCDEMLSENESDVLKRKSKKVRFSPQNDVFQLGDKKSERDLVVGNKGGVGRVTRGRASLGKTIVTGPVVMKKRGKRAVQEVEEGDLVVENEGGESRVTRARASLGKHVVISSPVVMKKRAKRAVQEVEKKDLDVEIKSGASRVTRARALLGEKVLIQSPVVMKKRGKSVVQEDEMGDSVVEHERGASPVTRNRAGKQVLISSPVVMKKRGKRAVQEEKKNGSASFQVVDFTSSDVEEENEMITVKFLRNRKVESVVSPKNIMRKRSTQKKSQSINADVSENKDAEADGGITQPKQGLRRSTRSVIISEESEVLMDETDQKVSRKNLRQGTRQRASAKSSIEDADKKSVGEISQPEVVTRQSKRNRMEFTQVEPSEENLGATEKAGRRKITRSRNQFQAKASTVSREYETRDASEEAKEVVVQVKKPLRRSGQHDNTEQTNFANDSELPIKSDESTRYQTRHGTKRMSVMPQMKKAKTEKPAAGNSGKKNVVVKDFPNVSIKPIVLEKGSETGYIRKSKRNASGDDLLVLPEDAKGSGSDIKKGTTMKRRRDSVLEEVPSQHTGKSFNSKAGNILEKLKEETPVASKPQTRSGSRQKSFMHWAKNLNMSGNLGPSRTSGEKTSPRHTREISMMPESSATATRQSKTMAVRPRTRSGSEQLKTVAVTPRTRSGSGQKSFIHTNKKLRMSGNFGPDKTIGDKESPHQLREVSTVPRRSKTDLKVRGSKSKQTPVAHEHSKRFTRSALKGKTDGLKYVRGKIYQKESQSISKLPLSKVESSLPKVILASEGPLSIDVQSSYHEVDRSAVNLVSSPCDLPKDGTACSTPQGISVKTSSVDLNVQESEGPELINIREASPSDPLKLQSDHAELEVEISAGEHALVERQTSYKMQSSIPKIAGCSTVPLSDASNSCGGVDTCAIVQDSVTATQANDKTPVQLEPAEDLDVAGDVASIDRNSVDDVIPSLEQTSSKGMEVNPQTIKYVEPSSGEIANVVLEGSTVPEEQSMNRLPFPEDGCSAIHVTEIGDDATQQVKSSETNVASPHLVRLKTDNAAGEGYSVDTNALPDLSLVDQLDLTRTKERPQLSKDVELISKGIDLNLVFQGPAIHEDEPVHQSPLAEVAEITDNPVTGNSDAGRLTQQEGPTEIDARSPPMVHPKSGDHVDIIGGAGTINTDSVDDNLLNVEQINLSEKQEASKNCHVVAEGSTVDEEKLTAEVGDCGPTWQEHDIRNHFAEFAESDGLDKDSRSAFKEDGEASFADLTNRTVSMSITEEKDDTMHPEIFVQAEEPHNTISKPGMQEMEFPVPNSILTTEEASILEYEFSKSELSDTVICSDKELADASNQRLSTVKSCLREESCTNKCIEFSTSNLISDSIARGNNILEPIQPKAPSAPLRVAEVGDFVEVNEELKPEDLPSSSPLRVSEVANLVVEMNEELKAEDSPSNWSSDILERAAVDGRSLPKERSSVISADVCGHNHSRIAKDESEFRKEMVSFGVDTELINKGEYSAVDILEKELEETVFEDSDNNDFERTSSLHGDAHHTLDSQLPVERKGDLEEMTRSISGDVEERRMSKNIGREKTPVILEVDRNVISFPVIDHERTDMSMVKSSRNFGKELSGQLDYCQRPLTDSCGKEQGTPMSMVKSSKNCGEEFSGQHDNIIEQVKVCDVATLPQTICEDFAGFDNQMVADLIGSSGRQISSTGALDDGKVEDTEPYTVITDKKVLEDGIETLKGNPSNLVRNLVEDCGGYCEKSDAEIISYVSEEDRYGKDTINSHRFDDTLQQFGVNYGETNSNLKGKCQERPYLVQMDVNSKSVESSRDSLIAVDTIHRVDQEADASGVPTVGLPRNEDAMDSDAPANLLYGGERVTLSGKTKQAQGLPTEELPRNEDAMDDADVPAHLQYGRESLTITGETNQVKERGPEEISFISDIFGSELNSRSDEVDGEESDIWFDDATFMLDKSGDAGKELDFTGFSTEEQLRNSGEGHGREKGPESIENQHAAFNNPSTGDDNISVENTLNESYLESEAHKDVHQKVDSCSNNTFDEDFTRTES